jgi:hypothetical protein
MRVVRLRIVGPVGGPAGVIGEAKADGNAVASRLDGIANA